MTDIKIISYNVRGIRSPERQARLLSYFLTITPSPSVLLIQDHQIPPEGRNDFAAGFDGQVFFSARCATLIPSASQLSSFHTIPQILNDRVLRITFTSTYDSYDIINIYAPVSAAERAIFFDELSLPHPPVRSVSILGGDLNDCPTPELDRHLQAPQPCHWPKLRDNFPLPMLDSVRAKWPRKAAFTRPHVVNGRVVSWSRIDFLLLQKSRRSRLLDAGTIYNSVGSDHRPVFMIVAAAPDPSAISPSLPSSNAHFSRLHPLFLHSAEAKVVIGASATRVLRSQLGAAAAWEEEKAELAKELKRLARLKARLHTREKERLTSEVELYESLPRLTETQQAEWTLAKTRLEQLTLFEVRSLNIRAHLPSISTDEQSTAAARRSINIQRAASTIKAISIPLSPTPSTDIDDVLRHTHDHFQAHYTRSAVSDHDRLRAQAQLLRHVEGPLQAHHSNPHISRRLAHDVVSNLDDPITAEEVANAIKLSQRGRSPGPSGLPYELYRAEPAVFAKVLARVFNDVWQQGALTPSMSEGSVRLLFKHNKPGACSTNLKHYRPITLRETDYKILSKVLVSRLNPILPLLLPPSQHGFVPGRQAADAGRHLSYLIAEVVHRKLPEAAVLSLDQASAYDLVTHDWIERCYSAYGFPPRFRALLRTIYDGTRLNARYNINGFLTAPVKLGVGLGQGDPLSCASWNITFQPFLDALVLRKIALQLQFTVRDLPRRDILTHLAFADDAIVVVRSPKVLSKLNRLRVSWEAATNGKLSTEKTEVLPLGPGWLEDDEAAKLPHGNGEDAFIWIGFAFSRDGTHAGTIYGLALDRLRRDIELAKLRDLTPSSRARYANLYLMSHLLHLLSYAPASSWFLGHVDRAIRDFVIGNWRFTTAEVIFGASGEGGLGAVRAQDVADTHSMKVWDAVAAGVMNPSYIWRDLAFLSYDRLTERGWSGIWHELTSSSAPQTTSHHWRLIIEAVRRHKPIVHVGGPGEAGFDMLLSLPPSYGSLYSNGVPPGLRSIVKIADLFRFTHDHDGDLAVRTLARFNSRHQEHAKLRPWFQHALHTSTLAAILPARPHPQSTHKARPTYLTQEFFSFFDLPRPYDQKKLRLWIVACRRDVMQRAITLPGWMGLAATERFWRWFRSEGVPSRERDVHWRYVLRRTATAHRLFEMGHTDTKTCQLCDSDSIEDDLHFFFGCPLSAEVWDVLSIALSAILDIAIATPFSEQPDHVAYGMPDLVSNLDRHQRRALRHGIALGFFTIHTARQRARNGGDFRPEREVKLALDRLMLRLNLTPA